MKIYQLLLAASVFAASIGATADSFIRVINNTDHPLQAIWQAGGCRWIEEDWDGDIQLTVCGKAIIEGNGGEARYDFSLLESDRSVKVFSKSAGRIAYCNSMDYSSVTVSEGEGNEYNVEYVCP